MAGLRTQGNPHEIPSTRHVRARRYHVSLPSGESHSFTGWRCVRVLLESNSSRMYAGLATVETTKCPALRRISTSVPCSRPVWSGTLFGRRSARLFPHFYTRARTGTLHENCIYDEDTYAERMTKAILPGSRPYGPDRTKRLQKGPRPRWGCRAIGRPPIPRPPQSGVRPGYSQRPPKSRAGAERHSATARRFHLQRPCSTRASRLR